MNIRKSVIACSTVLALGVTSLVVPQALAAPPQLEGTIAAPEAECVVKGSSTNFNRDYFHVTTVYAPTYANNERHYQVKVSFNGDTQRILRKMDLVVTMKNNGSNGVRYTMSKTNPADGTAPFDERNGEIAPGREIAINYEDTASYEPDLGDVQEWIFDVVVPADPVTNQEADVELTANVEGIVAPWPNEDEGCRQYIPQGNTDGSYNSGIIADGTPRRSYTLLSLWDIRDNRDNLDRELTESEAERIESTVYSRLGPGGPEDPIPGAKIELKPDQFGLQHHTISVPYGFVAPGTPDNEKPAAVYYQHVAQPRPETRNSKYAIYRDPFILKRKEDRTGRSLASHADFVGFAPLAKYDARFVPTKVRAGEVIEVNRPRIDETHGRQLFSGATVELSADSQNSPAKEWDPRIVDGVLRFNVPADARMGTVKFNVDLTYPDGSVDKNVPVELIVEAPVLYDEVTAKRGETVTFTPSKRSASEDVRYYLAEGQDLEGWNVSLKDDGSVELTVAEKAKDGERKSIEVNLVYPDGRVGTAHAVVNVRDKSAWWWLLTLPIVGGIGAYILDMLNRVPILPYPEPAPSEPIQEQPVEPVEPEKPDAPLPVDSPRKPIVAVPSGATALDSDVPVFVAGYDRD